MSKTFIVEVVYVLAIEYQLTLYCWFGNELTLAVSIILALRTKLHNDFNNIRICNFFFKQSNLPVYATLLNVYTDTINFE